MKASKKKYCKDCINLRLYKGYNICMSLGSPCGQKGKDYNEIYLKLVEPSKNIFWGLIPVRKGLLNENYDCPYYTRKWYKFWIK